MKAFTKKLLNTTLICGALGTTSLAHAWSVNDTYNKATATYNYLANHTNKHAANAKTYALAARNEATAAKDQATNAYNYIVNHTNNHAWNGYQNALAAKNLATQINGKVDAVQAEAANIRSKVDSIHSDLSSMNPVESVIEDINVQILVDHVQENMPMVTDRLYEISVFDDTAIRTSLHNIRNNLSKLDPTGQLDLGQVDNAMYKLIENSPKALLYPLAETDIVFSLDQMLTSYQPGAFVELRDSLPQNNNLRYPQAVACPDVRNLFESRPHLAFGMATSLEVLEDIEALYNTVNRLAPQEQTIGLTAVGGGTLTLTTPGKSIGAFVNYAIDSYKTIAERWLEREGECEQEDLQDRMEAFLAAQGF